MEFSFEFDCPQITTIPQATTDPEIQQLDLDLASPNDHWFTVDHSSELSTKKQTNPENNEEEEMSLIVRRQSARKHSQRKQLEQIKGSEQVETKVEWQQKEDIIPPNDNAFKKKKVHFKRNVLANPKILNPPQKLHKPKQWINSKEQQKGIVTRSKSEIYHKHGQSKDKWPCPMPTKIQRQWQHQNKVKWYDLSAISKKAALKSMRDLQNRDKSEISKNIDSKPLRDRSKRSKN